MVQGPVVKSTHTAGLSPESQLKGPDQSLQSPSVGRSSQAAEDVLCGGLWGDIGGADARKDFAWRVSVH